MACLAFYLPQEGERARWKVAGCPAHLGRLVMKFHKKNHAQAWQRSLLQDFVSLENVHTKGDQGRLETIVLFS